LTLKLKSPYLKAQELYIDLTLVLT